ncbi:MAG: mannose-1-phosphate guanylyltransferase/mannose-6-phosphate isomerase, partial [Gammaproteobacteria bacterium]|nr:mannose-1-phosphate guanylyltransferase/mannose-6-phosphate isomerase [Gammaproteobacteria bacterium]
MSAVQVVPVILSGGSGTRLWPLSRELFPKQLLPLTAEQTMLQQTVQRLIGLPSIKAPVVVCNNEHRFMVAEQLRQIDVDPAAILLEPVARNTAPAVAVAALAMDRVRNLSPGSDPLLLVLPADHVVAQPEALHAAIAEAVPAALDGYLVTFGIEPHWAETGYGYIRAGKKLADTPGVFAVEQFVEKPDSETAQSYLDAGGYFWNSGMFLFSARSFLAELGRHQPQMLEACTAAYQGAEDDLDFVRLERKHFAASPSDSIDYAVMEPTAKAAVVPLDAGWSDVGNWSA